MRRYLFACVTWTLVVALAAAQDREVVYLDLQILSNQALKQSLGNEGNNLAALPKGEQVFGGVRFKVGDRLVRLASTAEPGGPEKVVGIKVGVTVRKLHFLHACYHSAKDDAIIGYYTVRYVDWSKETVPIVYGKDIADWWAADDAKPPTRAKVGWKGSNNDAKNNGVGIRLYVTTWKNPEPARKVASVEFESTNQSEAAPFCVAITAEK